MTFTPKYSPAFRYWELALAASGLSSADDRGRHEVWRHWNFEEDGDPLMTGKPQCGYWRARMKDGSWEPVAITRDDYKGIPEMGDNLIAIRGQHRIKVPAEDAWSYCGRNPVSYEAYKVAYETGRFPGEIEMPGIGHNSGDDRTGLVRENLLYLTGKVEQILGGLADDLSRAQADELANFRDAINGYRKEADAMRKKACEAWIAAQKAENANWQPYLTAADEAAGAIKAKLKPYLEKDPSAKLGGQMAKRASLRTKWVAEITDWEAFAAYCSGHPRVREELQKCANAEARGSREEMPGVRYIEERTVV